MAHGLNSVVLKRNTVGPKSPPTTPDTTKPNKTGIGSRRIFAPHFKLQVLDSYRNDPDCKGNQRATARKYGIHRRQIQKWLQVESTLRNSLQNNNNNNNNYKTNEKQQMNAECKMDAVTLNGARPRVVDSTDGRGAPLDYTTHSHPAPTTLSPIDLSIKKEPTITPPPPTVTMTTTFYYNTSPPTSNEDNDAWDLSTKAQKRKLNDEDDTTLHKPIKLFKPYLDDVKEEEPTRVAETVVSCHPPCCSRSIHMPEPIYYTNNNNNHIVSEPYTIAELQPKGNVYYYHYNNIIYHPDYDVVGANGNYYEETGTYMGGNMKQHRQSYSLDFKLSAIDCYYQDSICKGNQRAVATKYNIHRRQVQKWLKQADELRMRNESMKQMHTVVR